MLLQIIGYTFKVMINIEAKNIDSFKELIAKYRRITIEEIEQEFKNIPQNSSTGTVVNWVANRLTGFSGGNCVLCAATRLNGKTHCVDCVYGENKEKTNVNCRLDETYVNILNAKTPQELYVAFQARAEYMENLIK